MKKTALIFGYNDYSIQIVKNISDKYEEIVIFRLDEDEEIALLDNYVVETFDLSDNWGHIEELYDIEKSVAFCVIEDDAENIFLTIALRSNFKDLNIIALSSDKESANKLSMAGANKVIPVVQTMANMISDILDKPIVTEVLHNILYERSDLKIAEIMIDNASYFNGMFPYEVDWEGKHGIIVLSIVHENGNKEFLYSDKKRHHQIKNGDILLVVGYSEDLRLFKNKIGGK